MDFNKLRQLIENRNVDELKIFIKENNLEIVDGKIYHQDKKEAKFQQEYWNVIQQTRKILLNSLYGSLLNKFCLYYNENLGLSTTLSGRAVIKHMCSTINQIIEDEYDHTGKAVTYGDTDSIFSKTLINNNKGENTIENLFNMCNKKWNIASSYRHDKEYATDDTLEVLSYNPITNQAEMMPINYIYRHKVSKEKYKITDIHDNEIIITGDHSIMVERDGILIEIKPRDILEDDLIISSIDFMNIIKAKVKKIEKLENFQDEYVYDIGIKGDTPYFFGNNILVHNSCYFSSYEKDLSEGKLNNIEDLKQYFIDRYDDIADQTNETFPEFLNKNFNVPKENAVIVAGRELVATKGLFIAKKLYALIMYEKENERLDIKGKPGKIKAMGLAIKRSDTPIKMQKFLEELLTKILTGVPEPEIASLVNNFRKEFYTWKDWEMGTPKKVNNLTFYHDKLKNSYDIKEKISLTKKLSNTSANKSKDLKSKLENYQKLRIPGHVTASIHWNNLREINKDNYSMPILDGQKVVVCKLKSNPMNIDSIAYPIDEVTLPKWFKELPFDREEMEFTIIDKKIKILYDALKWNMNETNVNDIFQSLFK